MSFSRASGVLLHPTSLPNEYGIGDLGQVAFDMVDLLASSGQRWWQCLPLNPIGAGDSPYSSNSAFAGNELLVSPEVLEAEGLIASAREYQRYDGEDALRVDYAAVATRKSAMHVEAFESYSRNGDVKLISEFRAFREQNAWWLTDLALFSVLKNDIGPISWVEWPMPIRRREKDVLDKLHRQYALEVEFACFRQFTFFRQWSALRKYAERAGIRFLGDMPIFVAHDSCDVWCNPQLFKLDERGMPLVVAGVPPDYFSETGQRWGNPIYDWAAMAKDGFDWWIARLAFSLRVFDAVRLDHFIGFNRNWEIPPEDETAENGEWKAVPGRQFFKTVRERLGEVNLIAEDLGELTADAEDLRDEFGFPGMRVLQFAFGGDANNRDLPHNYPHNSVAYTGTHDNDTTAGWWQNTVNAPEESASIRQYALDYLACDADDVCFEMIRAAYGSVADTAIIPMQDILGLGSEARMNTPATTGGNWSWRMTSMAVLEEPLERMKVLAEIYGR
jgi:4-alpha-glucanotransferase